jgi:hypothetical protein
LFRVVLHYGRSFSIVLQGKSRVGN